MKEGQDVIFLVSPPGLIDSSLGLSEYLEHWDCDCKSCSPDFEYSEVAQEEQRKSRNQNFKAAPAWMISSRIIESASGALLDFVFWRTAVNSAAVKSPELLIGVAAGVLQRSDTSFDTSRVESRSATRIFVSEKLCCD